MTAGVALTPYQARPGSTGDLVIRHIQAHGPTGELALAAAIDKEVGELGGLLAWPISKGALRKEIVGDEWVYSLGDGEPVAPAAAPAPGQKTPQQGDNRDASAGQSHGAGGSESPTGRGRDAAPALGASPVLSSVARPEAPPQSFTDVVGKAIEKAKRRVTAQASNGARPVDAMDGFHVEHEQQADKPAPSIAVAKPEVRALRIALWSDGTLEIHRGADDVVLFTRDEARQVVGYLDSIALDSVRGEGVA